MGIRVKYFTNGHKRMNDKNENSDDDQWSGNKRDKKQKVLKQSAIHKMLQICDRKKALAMRHLITWII